MIKTVLNKKNNMVTVQRKYRLAFVVCLIDVIFFARYEFEYFFKIRAIREDCWKLLIAARIINNGLLT